MKKLVILLLLTISGVSFGQESINLEECYNLVTQNYPLAKKMALIENQNLLDVEVLKTNHLPQLDFSAQATYQSDVIEIPISVPGVVIEPPNNDQYRATLSINQVIYDGGVVKASVLAKEAEGKTLQKNVEVSLFQLKKQINELYFSSVLLQEKKALLEAKKRQLEARLKEVKAGIEFGTLLPTSDSILEAELINVSQQLIELQSNKSLLLKTLSSIIGVSVSEKTILQTPVISDNVTSELQRPELDLFNLQKQQIDASENVLSKKNLPKLMGFVTGGYGNPGLDMLDNTFQPFYVVGAKLNWNVFDWNSNKKQKESLRINKDIVDNQQEVFELNTQIELSKYLSEMETYNNYIESDKTIIELRRKIVKTTESQLKNGVITASIYVTELTNLFEAENNLKTHTIKLLMAKANYNTTKGN